MCICAGGCPAQALKSHATPMARPVCFRPWDTCGMHVRVINAIYHARSFMFVFIAYVIIKVYKMWEITVSFI